MSVAALGDVRTYDCRRTLRPLTVRDLVMDQLKGRMVQCRHDTRTEPSLRAVSRASIARMSLFTYSVGRYIHTIQACYHNA